MLFLSQQECPTPISDRRNQTSTRAAHSPTCAACCTREDNSHAHRRAETTSSAHTDTHPCSRKAAAQRSCPRPHRNPCLSRTRSRQRNNRAPSPSATRATSTDRNPTELHRPIQTLRACHQSQSTKAARRHSAYRFPQDACKAQSHCSSHRCTASSPRACLQSSAGNHETPSQPAPTEPASRTRSAGILPATAWTAALLLVRPAPCGQSECCPNTLASSW